MLDSLAFMPELRVTEREEDTLATGGAITVGGERLDPDGEYVRLTADGEELAAVGRLVGDDEGEERAGHRIRPVRVFVEPF